MGTHDQDLARRWMDAANEDLALAELAVKADPPIVPQALFHAQQAAEKALKAVVINGGLTPARTHDLVALWMEAAKIAGWTRPHHGLTSLTSYAVRPRYPHPARTYSVEQAQQAIRDAAEIVALCSEATI